MQSWAQCPGSRIIYPLVSWSQAGWWPKVGEAPRNEEDDFKRLPVRPRAGGHHPLEETEGPQSGPRRVQAEDGLPLLDQTSGLQ